MAPQSQSRPSPLALLAAALCGAALALPASAQAQTCAPTAIAHSDHSGAGSVDGALYEPILVTCDPGYEGGGVTFCRADGTYEPLSCDAYTACSLPPGVTAVGDYLEGDLPLFVGDGLQTTTLRVQRYVKNGDGSFSTTPLTAFSDGLCPADELRAVRHLWQEFYFDMAARGMPAAQLARYFASISGQPGAGAYTEEPLNAGGYAITPGKITLWPGSSAGMKRYYAHENTHGWESQAVTVDQNPTWFKTFIDYTNRVYHQRVADPSALTGAGWSLGYENYGLQNDAEWGSEVFQEWLYGCCGGFGGNWSYIAESQPAYEAFFDCVWLEDSTITECQEEHLPGLDIQLPETLPFLTPPDESGFTAQESAAAWKACFDVALDAGELTAFQDMTSDIAPLLTGDAYAYYVPMVADCNHDGTLDWVCEYNGPGPAGVGNGQYLWNDAYTDGAYSFITSGDAASPWSQYTPDPYVADPISGYPSIIQPHYRHWQGEYGSCNGAIEATRLTAWGIDPFAAALAATATCTLAENLADPSCYSADLMLWLDAQEASSLLSPTGVAGDGDPLIAWRDKSAYVNDAVAVSSSKRPTLGATLLDGAPAVAFTDDILEMPRLNLTPAATPDLTSIIVSRRTGTRAEILVPVQNGFDKREHTSASAAAGAWSVTTMMLEGGSGGDTVNTWINGLPAVVDGGDTYDAMYPGAALGQQLVPWLGTSGYYPADHEIAEVLVIGRLLDAGEREAIEAQLSAKWAIRLDSTPCGATACTTLASEDFDSLALGPFVSSTESGGDGTDYTRAAPTGWTRDDSTTPVGSPEEFRGFTFLDRSSWIATAGDQDRHLFTRASGAVMVADGDEYDDGTSVEPGNFNAFMTTAAVDLTDVIADSVVVELDSSFRQWDAQTGRIDVSFDGGTSWDTLLTLTTANSGADLSRVNEHLRLLVDNPSGGTLTLRFAYLNAGNDWWWAIDNLEVKGAY